MKSIPLSGWTGFSGRFSAQRVSRSSGQIDEARSMEAAPIARRADFTFRHRKTGSRTNLEPVLNFCRVVSLLL
ncbi:MAG: hypothetical protein UD961_02655 [Bacteroidales bacterium]|nr:hypothetical protein [Bacteroidales bacterium]